MKEVVLIACASKKLDTPALAADIYASSLFRLNLAYARLRKPDAIYILSAKYGLVGLTDLIEPYDETLNSMPASERRAWAARVRGQLENVADLQADRFVFLAGEKYRRDLVQYLSHTEAPTQGMRIGQQLQWLKSQTQGTPASGEPRKARAKNVVNHCPEVHALVRSLPRYQFPFDPQSLPENGIYLLFERGERAHGGERIVRVGTHRGHGKLRSRLQEHFLKENKDRSIFRKNLGRAMLAQRNDPFVEQWEWDLTTSEDKRNYADLLDKTRQAAIESEISARLRNSFSFSVIEVAGKESRMALEAALIATVAACPDCHPSQSWFGNYAPDARIRDKGLWQVQHLKGDPLTREQLDLIRVQVQSVHRDSAPPQHKIESPDSGSLSNKMEIPIMNDAALRTELLHLLTLRQAHMDFEDAVANFPADQINTRPPHTDYTFWHLLEHLRLAQRDILEYIIADTYRWPDFPGDLWPDREATTDLAGWQATIEQFMADRQALADRVADPDTDLFAPLPHSGDAKHTMVREINIIAAHNAYHTGELGILRQVMGLW